MKQCRFDGRFAVLFSNMLDDLERECGLADAEDSNGGQRCDQ